MKTFADRVICTTDSLVANSGQPGALRIGAARAQLNAESYVFYSLGSWYTFNRVVADPTGANQQIVSTDIAASTSCKDALITWISRAAYYLCEWLLRVSQKSNGNHLSVARRREDEGVAGLEYVSWTMETPAVRVDERGTNCVREGRSDVSVAEITALQELSHVIFIST